MNNPEYDPEVAVRTWLTAGATGAGLLYGLSEGLNPTNRTIALGVGFAIGVAAGAVYDWFAYKRKGGQGG